jgi:hypothetical protein
LRLCWLEVGVANGCYHGHAPRPPVDTPIEMAEWPAPSHGSHRGVVEAA